MKQRLPILMYHQVTPHPDSRFRKYSVTPAELARQMRWLARAGFTAVTLDAVAEAYGGGGALPARAIAITFDDGMRDCLEYAPAVLATCGFTATFFLVTGVVGGSSTWLERERGVSLPMADWSQVRALEAAGFRCEAHSVTHPRLGELTPDACRRELVGARVALEDRLARAVRHMAYPFGSHTATVRSIAAEAGYATACTVREARATPGDDRLALPRVPVLGGESLADFVSRLYTLHPVAELHRAALRRAGAAVRRHMAGRPVDDIPAGAAT